MSPINKLEIAKMIDHSLLHPTMDDQTLLDGIALAKKYNVASVCIKPYAGKVRTLEDTLKVRALGVTRIGATATESIILAVEGEDAGNILTKSRYP